MLTFVESPTFTRLVDEYLTDDEFTALQASLASNPERGDVIPGSGGVRKLRWKLAGRGQRGGLRVIYYLRTHKGEIWLLTLYAKNETENIPAHILRRIREEIENA